jgi:hypothetical protein
MIARWVIGVALGAAVATGAVAQGYKPGMGPSPGYQQPPGYAPPNSGVVPFPGKPPPGSVPYGGQPGGPGPEQQAGVCTPQERELIENSFREAHRITAESLRRLEQNPELPQFRRFFGTAPQETVRNTLRLTADWLRERRPSSIACNHPNNCPQGRFAYASTQTTAMGFCSLFFNGQDTGFDSRAGVIIHEVTHVAARTRDIVYSPRNAMALAKSNPADAAVNADNYEYFIEAVRDNWNQ